MTEPLTRHDGWTALRRKQFVAALEVCGCVKQAAEAVGMTARSAHRLKAREPQSDFARGWDDALELVVNEVFAAASDRVRNGRVEPVFHRGRQIGERRVFDDRLAIALLKAVHPRYSD